MKHETKAIDSHVLFSDCQQYRFVLIRDYGELMDNKMLNFIMLNPSTADAYHNDPTIARCEKRCLSLKYRYLCITNLFAYRATDPKHMINHYKTNGGFKDKNNHHIIQCAKKADLVICGWGRHGKHNDRGAITKSLLKMNKIQAMALRINGDGTPAHPLYLPDELSPMKFA